MKLSFWIRVDRFTTPENPMSYFASHLPIAGSTFDANVYRVEVFVPDQAPLLLGEVVPDPAPASPQEKP